VLKCYLPIICKLHLPLFLLCLFGEGAGPQRVCDRCAVRVKVEQQYLQGEAQKWVEEMLGEFFPGPFGPALCTGWRLVALMNVIFRDLHLNQYVRSVERSNSPAKQMRHILHYLRSAQTLGVPKHFVFFPVELQKGQNIDRVARHLLALREVVSLKIKSQKNAPPTSRIDVERSKSLISRYRLPRPTTPNTPHEKSSKGVSDQQLYGVVGASWTDSTIDFNGTPQDMGSLRSTVDNTHLYVIFSGPSLPLGCF
jgi:hypothetical protein